jgi:hypothetical protein
MLPLCGTSQGSAISLQPSVAEIAGFSFPFIKHHQLPLHRHGPMNLLSHSHCENILDLRLRTSVPIALSDVIHFLCGLLEDELSDDVDSDEASRSDT